MDVPTAALTDPLFGKERACLIDPLHAAAKPVAPGNVSSYDGVCPAAAAALADEKDTENISTTNLTVADKWGNVVEYTLTIEQTGGSGMVVPGRGFLLNNELTDFSTVYDPTDPNRIEPGKRPRSSMAPTIVLKDGRAVPRARLTRRIDHHHDRPADHPEPGGPGHDHLRGHRGTACLATEHGQGHRRAGVHRRVRAASWHRTAISSHRPGMRSPRRRRSARRPPSSSCPDGRMVAAAEPVRRGGGSAMVLKQSR